MGRLIDREKLIAEYDRVHVGPPGGARKLMEEAEEVPAIPVDYLNSRIAEFRAKDTYANQFAADFLQAIINEYSKEVHNDKTE